MPKKKKLVKRQETDPTTGKPKTRLRFEDVDKPAPASKLSHAVKAAPLNAVSVQAHRKIQEAEQENVGVESAYRLEEAAEGGARLAAHSRRAQKLKPYREAEKARMRMGKANVNALYQKHIRDNPQLTSNPISRWQQKRAIRKQYAASVRSGLGSSTYPSADADMLGAETAYSGMEAALKNELDNYATLHPGHDEYQFELDEIGHDPYVLISLLTAYHRGGWTLADVGETLEMLFERQYTLTETVTRTTRYDENDQPYEYTVCKVKLVNFDLSHLPIYVLDEDGMHFYAAYMATLGNRPDLFPTSEYPNASQREDYLDYDVPPEALEDEVFAAMLKEAEKYLGFPYVWGGTNPNTSFDCSGFVSWVINHSGWNYGRLGVIGLENVCTPVSRSNARPGDLVFFIGTYDAPYPDRPSHVGIYVGNGMMIHCGSPISYANINTPYWQNHFYGFGRLREP